MFGVSFPFVPSRILSAPSILKNSYGMGFDTIAGEVPWLFFTMGVGSNYPRNGPQDLYEKHIILSSARFNG